MQLLRALVIALVSQLSLYIYMSKSLVNTTSFHKNLGDGGRPMFFLVRGKKNKTTVLSHVLHIEESSNKCTLLTSQVSFVL